MTNCDINMERFAYDVCVNVLEKFGIFKAPDDTRKQNKYISYDFLSSVSRLVVSYSIWMRDDFKNTLDDKYRTDYPIDKEKIWNFFDDYLLQNDDFVGKDSTGKICISLALCTEYIQFVSRKDFSVSLNKIVIRWGEFFEKYLKVIFEAEGGFPNFYSSIKSCKVDQIDNFHKMFISEYCLPYGAKECTRELAKKCAENHGIQLDFILGFNKNDINEDLTVEMSDKSAARCSKELSRNLHGSGESKSGETRSETSDSESSSCNTDESEKTDSEISRNKSEVSESEMRYNLLGIPPHEDILREIDPFFVENIPPPPKPHSTSKSLECQPDSSDPQSSSKSQENEPGSNDASKPEEFQEKMEHILAMLEYNMQALKALLSERGLISMKSNLRKQEANKNA